MKKLALRIEELKVETFSTSFDGAQRGTVRARDSASNSYNDFTCDTCDCRTNDSQCVCWSLWDSCIGTCPDTCSHPCAYLSVSCGADTCDPCPP
jgi:hypothetical protein